MLCHLNYKIDKDYWKNIFFENIEKGRWHWGVKRRKELHWYQLFVPDNSPLKPLFKDIEDQLGISGMNTYPRFSYHFPNIKVGHHLDEDKGVKIQFNLLDTTPTIHIKHKPYPYDSALIDVGHNEHGIEKDNNSRLVLQFFLRHSWDEVYDRLNRKGLIDEKKTLLINPSYKTYRPPHINDWCWPENNTFHSLSIQTTYQCNMKCANCYLGDMLNNPKFPNVDMIKFEEAISRLPKRCDIRFIGAEPTMNENLFDLIKIVRRYKHKPSLLTNGLKLFKEQYVIDLKKSGLNFLGLSMNGGLDDEVYKRFDNGKYAKAKMKALENCIKHKIVPHINVIVDPTNIHILKPLLDYIIMLCKKYNRTPGKTFPIMMRIKSVGKMGNYLDTYTYNINELINIAKENFGDFEPIFEVQGYKEKYTCVFNFKTEIGTLYGKATDWSIDDDGLPDSGSKRRGILTDEYKIEPFFEYYGGIDETQSPRLEK